MEKKEIRPGDTITVAGIELTPVIRIHARSVCKPNLSALASKSPVALIIKTPAGRKIFKITGEVITDEEFTCEFGDYLKSN